MPPLQRNKHVGVATRKGAAALSAFANTNSPQRACPRDAPRNHSAMRFTQQQQRTVLTVCILCLTGRCYTYGLNAAALFIDLRATGMLGSIKNGQVYIRAYVVKSKFTNSNEQQRLNTFIFQYHKSKFEYCDYQVWHLVSMWALPTWKRS